MAIYDFFLSRNNGPTINDYVGNAGRLFYDDATGEIRISNGSTPGGTPIPITLASQTVAGAVKLGPGFTVNGTGTLTLNAGPSFFLDETDTFRLRPGSSTLLGGIKAGPGIVIDLDGTLFIDSEGLEFTFGDFTALIGTYPNETGYAILGSIKADEDIVIASNGSGAIKVVGEFAVYATDGDLNDILAEEPFFRVLTDGKIRSLVPVIAEETAAFEIIGNNTGATVAPDQQGVVLHVTGNPNLVSRNYFDGVNSYALIVGRRYNGNSEAPTRVLNNELFFRIAGQAATNGGFETFGPAQIDWVATEDQGPNNQGGELRIRATPNGSSALGGIVQVAAFNATTGVTAIKFNGPLTGNVTGNVSGNAGTVTNGVYTTDTATVTNTMLAGSIANNKLSNSTVTVNGTSIALGASGTVTAAAGTLTGTTLASTVVTSSLTSVGTLTNLTVTNTIVGSINGNASTATTATNLAAATGILAGSITVDPASVTGGVSSTQTFTLTGLTTNHKVVITSGTAFNSGLIIQSAWASAVNTISIEFRNTTNQLINANATVIQYFAWV
jgi:hypothetical protein